MYYSSIISSNRRNWWDFRGALTQLPIRLLRCPDRSLTAKPAQRATDGRPYELKSVPTKTVAICTTGNCSDLVQKLYPHPAFPFEGKVSAKPTDEVIFKSVRSAHTSIIHYSLFTINYSFAGTACAALTGSEVSWFPPMFRTVIPQ